MFPKSKTSSATSTRSSFEEMELQQAKQDPKVLKSNPKSNSKTAKTVQELVEEAKFKGEPTEKDFESLSFGPASPAPVKPNLPAPIASNKGQQKIEELKRADYKNNLESLDAASHMVNFDDDDDDENEGNGFGYGEGEGVDTFDDGAEFYEDENEEENEGKKMKQGKKNSKGEDVDVEIEELVMKNLTDDAASVKSEYAPLRAESNVRIPQLKLKQLGQK